MSDPVSTKPATLPKTIAAVLEPGEEVVWQGRPRPYVFILRGMPAIFLGMVFSILGAFWYHGASIAPWMGWWVLVPTFSLPFIGMGWSFFLYPINLGARARHTFYLVTNRRVMIVRWHSRSPAELRVFNRVEMGPTHVIKRLDGLYEVILTKSAQDKPYLIPRLEAGFFGIPDGEAAAKAIREWMIH